MNLMLGFLKPISGEIIIDAQVLNNSNIQSWQKNWICSTGSIFIR